MNSYRCPTCGHSFDADVDVVFVSIHGRDACPACLADHDAACCRRCAMVGNCPVHGHTSDPDCAYYDMPRHALI